MSNIPFKLIDGLPLRPALGVAFFVTLIIWGLLTAALIYHWRRLIFKRRALILAETTYLVGSLVFIGAATFLLAAM